MRLKVYGKRIDVKDFKADKGMGDMMQREVHDTKLSKSITPSALGRIVLCAFLGCLLMTGVGCSSCAPQPAPSEQKIAVTIESIGPELRAIAADGSVVKTLNTGVGHLFYPSSDSSCFGVLRGGFTYYDNQLNAVWTMDKAVGDPLGGDIQFANNGRVVLFINRAATGELAEDDPSAKAFILVKDEKGNVIFEKTSVVGGFLAGVAISPDGGFLAYGENPQEPLTVINLKTKMVRFTEGLPHGKSWDDLIWQVTSDGDIESLNIGTGLIAWKADLSW